MATLPHLPGSDSLLELPRMISDPIEFLRVRHAAHGDIFKSRLIVPVVYAVGPDANQTIMVTDRDRFSHARAYGDLAVGKVFAGSLLVKDGAPHRHDRDILQPAVGRLGLSQALERVQESWTRGSSSLAERGSVDVYLTARDVTMEVSANALVDLELTELDDWRFLFEDLIAGALAHTTWRIPFGALNRGLKARDLLKTKLRPRVIQARHREPNGMLGLLAHHREQDGSQLEPDDVANHILMLFWAGYDTTATTGAWVLHKLADNPEWQDRLHAEMTRVLGDDTRDITLEDADKLVELGWFLKEIERTCPVVLFFPRRTTDDVEIIGQKVPRNTLVFWSPFLTHMSPRVFDAPEKFDPERFSPARGDKQAKLPFLVGFGAGPRICLGKSFALLQLRVMTTTIVRRYRIERVAQGSVMPLPTLRPNGSMVRFIARENSRAGAPSSREQSPAGATSAS